MRKKSWIFFVLTGFAVFLASCSLDNVKQDNSLKKYFDENGVEGSFALFDNGRGAFIIYNLKRDTTRILPASTFDILHAMIALQTGAVTTDSTILKWDGIERPVKGWNKDLTLAEAFQYSAIPHFQGLARNIGRDTMQKWVDSVKYGNAKIGPAIDSFWLDNSLLISPDEELGLIKKLYFSQLPFRKGVQQLVRGMLLQEENSNYSLSYKAAAASNAQGGSIGWLVGWIEENNHPYFFSLNIESADKKDDILQAGRLILNDILKQEGFFEGKM